MSNLEIKEVQEIARNFEVEGISNHITRTSISEMKYPSIIIVAKDKNPKRYKIQVLNSMKIQDSNVLYSGCDTTITVYIRLVGSDNFEVGKVYQTQLRSLIKMFEDECDLEGYMSNKKKITGKYVYSMCV